jgi:hypothetical protein
MRADKAVLDQNGRRASLSVTGQGPITYGYTSRDEVGAGSPVAVLAAPGR